MISTFFSGRSADQLVGPLGRRFSIHGSAVAGFLGRAWYPETSDDIKLDPKEISRISPSCTHHGHAWTGTMANKVGSSGFAHVDFATWGLVSLVSGRVVSVPPISLVPCAFKTFSAIAKAQLSSGFSLRSALLAPHLRERYGRTEKRHGTTKVQEPHWPVFPKFLPHLIFQNILSRSQDGLGQSPLSRTAAAARKGTGGSWWWYLAICGSSCIEREQFCSSVGTSVFSLGFVDGLKKLKIWATAGNWV